MSQLLQVDELGVRFGGLKALEGVTLQVGPDEVLGIIGPNGAGKTTLLNAIGGLVPSSGHRSFAGTDLRGVPIHRLRRLGIARSFQHPQMDGRMTVREVLGLGSLHTRRYGWPTAALGSMAPRRRREERQVAAELEPVIDTLDLTAWLDARIADVPHGIGKLVDIARALVGEPRLLLLDEPFAGLSDAEADQVIEAVRRRAVSGGAATVLIDHHVESVVAAATTLCAMVSGRVAAHGSAHTVLADETVKVAYLG
jgi:branched-chain amino acid transport system ATP-binding protein